MVELIINKFMERVKNTNQYSEEDLEEIEFGIATMLLSISKIIILFLIAFLMNMGLELFLFFIVIIPIRKYSYGFHANSNSLCWILTIGLNLIFCYLAINLTIEKELIVVLMIFLGFIYYLFAPADIENLPLISKKDREKQCIISVTIITLYTIIVLFSNNILLNNIILVASIFQALLISPFFYLLFNTPYRNYLKYEEN